MNTRGQNKGQASFYFESLNDADMLLLSPHPTSPVMPLAALGYLASKIRSLGIKLELLDLGIDLKNWFISGNNLQQAFSSYKENQVTLRTRMGGLIAELSPTDIIENSERAHDLLKQPYLDGTKHEWACLRLVGTYGLYENPTQGRVSPPGRYMSPWEKKSPFEEIQADLLGEKDLFTTFTQKVTTNIIKRNYRLIGFSICHGDQLIPAFGLAKELRRQGYDGIIVFGGVQISFLHDHILKTPSFFKYVDWFVPKKGEQFFTDVAQWLLGKLPPQNIHNLTYISPQGDIVYTKGYEDPPFSSLLPPDYEGLPLNDYLVPSVTLPLQTSSKCYWSQCQFCTLAGNYLVEKYDSMQADQVFNHIRHLYEKHHCQDFFYTDDSVSVPMLTKLAKEIISHNLPIRWQVMGLIPEASLTRDVLSLWAKSGCTYVAMGVESGSERLLKTLNKKHSLKNLERILTDCYELQIMTYCYTFYGHPLEDKEDLLATINFKKKYEKIVTHFATSIWRITPFNKDYQNLERLGIQILPKDNYIYGLTFPALSYTSSKKQEMKGYLDDLVTKYGHDQKSPSYLGDWLQYGHGTHVPFAWANQVRDRYL